MVFIDCCQQQIVTQLLDFCHSIKNATYYKSSFFGWIPGISIFSTLESGHTQLILSIVLNPRVHPSHFTGFCAISVMWRISNFLKMNLGWNDKSLWDFRHKIKLLWLDIIPKWHILQFWGFKFWNIFANLHNTDKL